MQKNRIVSPAVLKLQKHDDEGSPISDVQSDLMLRDKAENKCSASTFSFSPFLISVSPVAEGRQGVPLIRRVAPRRLRGSNETQRCLNSCASDAERVLTKQPAQSLVVTHTVW